MTLSISCIDAKNYQASLHALKITLQNVPYCSVVYWLSDKPIPEEVGVPVQWVRIRPYKKNLVYNEWYSYSCLRLLPAVVDTDFNLIIHPDGFAINKEAWTDEFLNYDYIGAPRIWDIPAPGSHPNFVIGNGGFSLRSRKLYDALIEWHPGYQFKDWPSLPIVSEEDPYVDNLPRFNYYSRDINNPSLPEDRLLSTVYRPYLESSFGIKYAPVELAHQFAIEGQESLYTPWNHWVGKSFGFHGVWAGQLSGVQF